MRWSNWGFVWFLADLRRSIADREIRVRKRGEAGALHILLKVVPVTSTLTLLLWSGGSARARSSSGVQGGTDYLLVMMMLFPVPGRSTAFQWGITPLFLM